MIVESKKGVVFSWLQKHDSVVEFYLTCGLYGSPEDVFNSFCNFVYDFVELLELRYCEGELEFFGVDDEKGIHLFVNGLNINLNLNECEIDSLEKIWRSDISRGVGNNIHFRRVCNNKPLKKYATI